MKPNLTAGARRLLNAMQITIDKSGPCVLSQSHMARTFGVTVRQIRRYVRELREAHLIKVKYIPNKSARYSLLPKTDPWGMQ